MCEVILLNLIFSPDPFTRYSKLYIYGDNGLLEMCENNQEVENIKDKYTLEDEYTWYFKNESDLELFFENNGVKDYFGGSEFGMSDLTKYCIRSQNYYHTGQGMKKIFKGSCYLGVDQNGYICVSGNSIYNSLWITTNDISMYYLNHISNEIIYDVPSGVKIKIIRFLETDILNYCGRTNLSRYIIENNMVIFK